MDEQATATAGQDKGSGIEDAPKSSVPSDAASAKTSVSPKSSKPVHRKAGGSSVAAATIKIHIQRARKLESSDGASDPYVVVFLKTEDEAGARRTKTIDDTLEPGRACVRDLSVHAQRASGVGCWCASW